MLGSRHFAVVLHPAGKPAARRGRGVHPLKAAVHIQLRRRSVAGGQLRVVLKTSEGQEIVASRYGIDTNVSVGEKVRCCFLPTDAVLVDREERSEEVLPDQSGPCAGGTHA